MTIYWLSFLVFNIDVFLHFSAMFAINPPIIGFQISSVKPSTCIRLYKTVLFLKTYLVISFFVRVSINVYICLYILILNIDLNVYQAL